MATGLSNKCGGNRNKPLHKIKQIINQMKKSTKRFLKFHGENPQVYSLFCRVTFQAMQKGLQNFGSSAVFEIMRWETNVISSLTTLTLCNTFKPYYARLFEMQHPIYKGYFRNKLSVADEILEYADMFNLINGQLKNQNNEQLELTY